MSSHELDFSSLPVSEKAVRGGRNFRSEKSLLGIESFYESENSVVDPISNSIRYKTYVRCLRFRELFDIKPLNIYITCC